jgi:hypothetical protein
MPREQSREAPCLRGALGGTIINVMLRIGLVLYLTGATVAAPGLCCCSLGWVFSSSHTKTPAPSAPHTCCGQCEIPATAPVTDAERKPDTPAPTAPNRPCPCRERLRDGPALTTTDRPAVETAASFVGPRTLEPTKWFAASVPDGLDTGEPTGGPIAFPYHSPRGILRALHILLC